MTAQFDALLKGFGIHQTTPGHTSNASQVRALGEQLGTRPSKAVIAPSKAVSQPLRVSPVPVVHSLISQAKDDSAWSAVGKIFRKSIEVVDIPRSYAVSAVKELSDLGNEIAGGLGFDVSTGETGASWSDFVRQGKHHIGFGDVVHAQSKHAREGNKWIGRVAGFAGDVALDPLTHASAAARGGSEALEQALHAGGRKEVGKAVAEAVGKVSDEKLLESGKGAIDQLVADSARKGRGALTKKGLAKAGVTAADAETLGIPKMGYELFGAKIPGSTVAAEALANSKGELKAWLGGTRAAKAFRSLRVTENDGILKLTNIIRESSGDSARQADAVRTLLKVTEARAVVRKLGRDELAKLQKSELGQLLKNPPPGLLRDTESATSRTLLNDWLDHIHQLATEAGVEVPYRENYVPHIPTREVRNLARKDATVRAVVESIDKKEGFQLAREGTGTVAEENARFALEHPGVKLFEDDPAIIATNYLNQFERAVQRAHVVKGLEELGVATPLPEFAHTLSEGEAKVTQEMVDSFVATPDQLGQPVSKVIKDTKKTLTDTEKAHAQAAKDGMTLHEHEGIVASAALKDQRASQLARIGEIDTQVKDLSKRYNQAEAEVRRLQGKVPALEKKRDAWVSITKRERDPLRREAVGKVQKLNNEIEKTTAQLDAAKASFKKLKDGDRGGSRGFAHDINALNEERDTLQAAYTDAVAQADAVKLSTTPPGAGPLLSDAQVAEANTKLTEMNAKVGRARTDADIVANVYDAVVADREALIPMVDEEVARLDEALKAIPKKKKVGSASGMTKYGADINENLRLARELVGTANTPASQLMAQFEAAAAMADARALHLSYKVDFLKDTIESMHDPRFRTYLQKSVADGMQRVNETLQIPDWVDNALQVNKLLDSDKAWGEWTRAYDKTLNVLKGYMVARPGFFIRNAYSSMFNVYLEGGAKAMKSIAEYERFYRIAKANPEDYLEKATAKWGAEKANLFDRALAAQRATGFGQAADEFHVGAFSHISANPLNPSFAPIHGIRAVNEGIENIVRGGHALDVLKRGGSDSLAVDTLEKWHFNYHDITDFDRKMKRVMPFWSFFSNNIALQAQTFPQILPKLNRTYFNLQRNLSAGETPDTMAPKYFTDSLPIRLPGGGGAGTNVKYLFPDLPSLQVVRDADALAQTKGGSLVAQMNPGIKIGVDALLGDKNSFTGQQFTDKFHKTPVPLPSFLPGVDEGGDSGQSVWTDRTKYVYENLFPTLGQTNRLADTSKGYDNLLSFLGVGVRTNTDKTRKGEELRRARVQKSQLDQARDLGRV